MRLLIFVWAVLGQSLATNKEKFCNVRQGSISYNFSNLVKDEDYTLRHGNGVLRLRLCEPLKKDCDGQAGYFVCLSKHGKEIGIGMEPPDTIPEFNKIIFKYTGALCDSKNNIHYTVNIKMMCDFDIKDRSGIEFEASALDSIKDSNDCEYNILWKTNLACAPRKQVNCTLDNGSNHYDLTKLINYYDNYDIPINENYSVILNVCHSIWYSAAACKSTNAICLINKQEDKKKSLGLGEPKQDLRLDSNGHLLLTYEGGAICTQNTTAALPHMQATITFICDLDAIGTLPQYNGGMQICNYNFTWKTALACTEQALHEKSLKKANTDVCAVKDPVTNHMYNLTALMNREFSVKLFATNEIYKFSICSPLVNTTCKTESGACRLHNNMSGGIANSKLMWKQTGPYLNYTNGYLCNGNKQQRYTIIEFYCGDKYDYEINENDLCYEVIKISTNLACNTKKNECATPNNEISLRSLIRQNINYVTKSNGFEFYMNICRPLVENKNSICMNGTAICKAVIENEKVINTINLGYPDENPILTSDRSVTLIYHNGSICEEDEKRRIESRISFFCDPFLSTLTKGSPQFMKYEDCTYLFNWKTNIVCGKVDGNYGNNFITNTLGDHKNLSVLAMDKDPVYHVENKKKNKVYKISFSSNKKYCHGALICDNEMNYGTKVSVLWDYTHNLIRLSLTEGSKCNDGSLAQSIFTMICDEKSLSDEPVFLREDVCSVEFEWYTNKICKSQDEQTSTITTASGGEIIIIIIIIVIILLIICCLQNSTRQSRFCDLITNSTTRSCDRVKYSRVNTVEEVHLLLDTSDPTVIESDSDDDLLEA